MREPVAKRRPLIDLDEFERRLRPPGSAKRKDEDPLVELARLPGGRGDPYKTVFEPLDPPAAEAWRESEYFESHAQESYGAREPYGAQESYDAQESYGAQGSYDAQAPVDGRERHIGGDYAAIEAGLLGAARQDPPFYSARPDRSDAYAGADLGSDDWRYDDGAALSQHGESEDEIRSKRPLYLMAAIIVLGIAGIGASFAFKGSVSGPREIATIKPAAGPVKIQPAATASADVPNQDDSILNGAPQPTPAALVNDSEQPVDLSQAAEKAHLDDSSVGGAASVPVPPPPQTAQQRALAQREPRSIADLIEPKKVKTISVRPDGTVLPNDKPPPLPDQASARAGSRSGVNSSRASTPKSTARVATTPKSAGADGSEAEQPSQAANVARPKPTQIAEATPEQPALAKSEPSGGRSFSVQLAAPASEQEARAVQVRLMKKLGSELSGFHPAIHKVSIGAKTVYRVRVANLSHEEAISLCEKVRGGGGACFVARD